MNSTSINPSSGFGQVGSVDLGSDPARTPNYLATKSNNNKPGKKRKKKKKGTTTTAKRQINANKKMMQCETYGIGQSSKADDAACGLTWDRRSSL